MTIEDLIDAILVIPAFAGFLYLVFAVVSIALGTTPSAVLGL